ncbi:metal-sulfur cluster assembly factor [Corynebacterium sphenisci]|uniref:metal-sulfur cluster assembly factor n=1 Tax=Corynebacterium sphenisci TaxID=191493 RepID=UPI00095147BF|nr:metal-sulfur cluster assembly factor [Corynebacterium sphenisci]
MNQNEHTPDAAAAAEAEAARAARIAEEENTLGVPERPEQSAADEQLAIQVEEAMYDVVDPEIGINVVDLGLVYDIWIEDGSTAVIHMTLTSPACPLTDLLTSQTESLVMDLDGIEDYRINWVWSPPWGPQFITEDGRDQMRALGFSV